MDYQVYKITSEGKRVYFGNVPLEVAKEHLVSMAAFHEAEGMTVTPEPQGMKIDVLKTDKTSFIIGIEIQTDG